MNNIQIYKSISIEPNVLNIMTLGFDWIFVNW